MDEDDDEDSDNDHYFDDLVTDRCPLLSMMTSGKDIACSRYRNE